MGRVLPFERTRGKRRALPEPPGPASQSQRHTGRLPSPARPPPAALPPAQGILGLGLCKVLVDVCVSWYMPDRTHLHREKHGNPPLQLRKSCEGTNCPLQSALIACNPIMLCSMTMPGLRINPNQVMPIRCPPEALDPEQVMTTARRGSGVTHDSRVAPEKQQKEDAHLIPWTPNPREEL